MDVVELTERERYLLDLRGFLVRPGVLDALEVEAINVELEGADFGSDLSFPIPWSGALARLAIHPAAVGPMKWLCGENLRLDQAYGIRQDAGDEKSLVLHGSSGFPVDHYAWHPTGQVLGGMCVATWVLTDQPAGGGGFRCVPGSHKATFPIPRGLGDDEIAIQLGLAAGDLLVFSEALTHGTLPWTATHQRRALLYKYCPGSMAWNRPEQIRAELLPYVSEVGDTLRVLLEPPYWGDRWPGTY